MRVFASWFLLGVVSLAAGAGFGQAPASGKPDAKPDAKMDPKIDAKPEAASAAPAVVEATPALWKVKGVHGTAYLFGSVHVMKKEVHWETAKVKDALKASDTLYLEIAGVDEESVKAAQPEILALGLDQEHPLSTKISKEDLDLLDAALKSMGLPGEQSFEPMQPWLANLTISVLPVIRAGYDPNSGIDKTLEAEVKGTKTVKGLETMSKQLHYLSDMPTAVQVEMLHQSLTDLPTAVSKTDAMVADWEHGDVEAVGNLENEEMKAKYPDLYDRLLVKRNVGFADALVGILKDPATGTVFVAVGAAHLAGSDSLVKMLGARGYAAERVE